MGERRHSKNQRVPALTLLAVCVLVGGLAFGPAIAAGSKAIMRAKRGCDRASRAVEKGDLAAAEALFEKALAGVPSFPPAHIGLGNLAMSQGQFDKALNHYRQARDGYGVLGEALLEIEQKRYADAQREIASFADSLNQGPNLIAQASIQNQMARLDVVQPPDPESIGEPPGEIFFYIGNALFRLGRDKEALAAWKRCAEKSPNFAMVYNNLALIQWRLGDIPAAQAALAKAEELGFPVHPQFKADLTSAGQ